MKIGSNNKSGHTEKNKHAKQKKIMVLKISNC